MRGCGGGHARLWRGGMHGCGGGACMVVEGVRGCGEGGMHGCGGHAWLWGGACMIAGRACVVVGRGCVCVGHDEIWSMSGRYASYLNAFLFKMVFSLYKITLRISH